MGCALFILKSFIWESDNYQYTGSSLHREDREKVTIITYQGKHREFGNYAKTQGKHREICLLKSCKFPALKNTGFHNICCETFEISAVCSTCEIWAQMSEIGREKISRWTGKTQGIYTKNMSRYPDTDRQSIHLC